MTFPCIKCKIHKYTNTQIHKYANTKKTKCLKDPICAIFLKSMEFKDIESIYIQGDPKKMSHSVLQLKSVVGVQSYFFRGVSESEFRARSNQPLYRYPFRILNGSKSRARTQFFRLFEHKQENSKQRAANFSNFSLRFLKRPCSTKSTHFELNQCFGISVTAMIMCCPHTPFLSESFHSVI